MAYNVYFSCDSCGATYNWVNHAVSYSAAVSIAGYEVDGGIVGGVYIYDTKEQAAEAWNRRVNVQ